MGISISQTQFYPTCKVCERGLLVPKKMFRMSGPVVAIGFILLIPSALGIIAAAVLFFGLIASNVTGPSGATDAPNVVNVVGQGFAIALGIASFVGGLLGWLLVMKKRVLKCSVCGATVNAS
jgi:hypothetical protein